MKIININDLVNDLKKCQTNPPSLCGLPISCLLYADDLVLLSETPEGLQNALNVLNSFCNKWFLTVNLPKTKYLVFSKTNSVFQNYTFRLGKEVVSSAQSYCYLGITIFANGCLKENGNILKEKANRALFALQNKVLKYQINSNTFSYNLFDKLIKPII